MRAAGAAAADCVAVGAAAPGARAVVGNDDAFRVGRGRVKALVTGPSVRARRFRRSRLLVRVVSAAATTTRGWLRTGWALATSMVGKRPKCAAAASCVGVSRFISAK